MKAILTSLVLVAGALAQSPTFTINTPANAVVCQPLLLTWSGGTPPYFLSILPGGQPGAGALVDLGQQTGTMFTWNVNQAVGTSLGLNLRDSSGQVAQSAPFNVNAGPDTSCVGHDPSSSAAAPGSAPASTGAAPPATTGATTPAATTTPAPATSAAPPPTVSSKPATSAAASSASRSSAAASASASATNAASANFAQIGTAGVVGAALAAFLV